MKSPKDRFLLATDDARLHADLVVQPWFIRAIDAALLQLTLDKTGTMNGTEAAVFQFQLAGARQFISTFEQLSQPKVQRTPPPTDSLPNPLA